MQDALSTLQLELILSVEDIRYDIFYPAFS